MNSSVFTASGSVTQWGETNAAIPGSVIDVAYIASGTNFHLALLSNATVVAWGGNDYGQTDVPTDLTNVVGIAAGGSHALALREDGHVIAWGNHASGQTNVPTDLTNAMGVAAGWSHSAALRNDGTVVCWGDNTEGQTNTPGGLHDVKLLAAGGNQTLASVFDPLVQYPVDVSQDLLLIYNTNSGDSIFVKDYYLAHRPMVGGANVLGISYTNSMAPGYYETITPEGYTNQIQQPVLAWLAANPTKVPQYIVLFLDVPSRIFWNTSFPTNGIYPRTDNDPPAVGVMLRSAREGWQPFVTHINMGSTNYGSVSNTADCVAYINKLAWCGSNYSPGQVVLSGSKGGYANTNFVVDNVRAYAYRFSSLAGATNGLLAAGVSPSAILYSGTNQPCLGQDSEGNCTNELQLPQFQITNAFNMAGYISWGVHSSWLGPAYPVDGKVLWSGHSTWWLIESAESFNGLREWPFQGHFIQWFSPGAFGGSDYSNTPVGAVTHINEPTVAGINNPEKYFGLWASRHRFATAAWLSKVTDYFQAVGDPLISK